LIQNRNRCGIQNDILSHEKNYTRIHTDAQELSANYFKILSAPLISGTRTDRLSGENNARPTERLVRFICVGTILLILLILLLCGAFGTGGYGVGYGVHGGLGLVLLIVIILLVLGRI